MCSVILSGVIIVLLSNGKQAPDTRRLGDACDSGAEHYVRAEHPGELLNPEQKVLALRRNPVDSQSIHDHLIIMIRNEFLEIDGYFNEFLEIVMKIPPCKKIRGIRSKPSGHAHGERELPSGM